jgi:hypothetical protein
MSSGVRIVNLRDCVLSVCVGLCACVPLFYELFERYVNQLFIS